MRTHAHCSYLHEAHDIVPRATTHPGWHAILDANLNRHAHCGLYGAYACLDHSRRRRGLLGDREAACAHLLKSEHVIRQRRNHDNAIRDRAELRLHFNVGQGSRKAGLHASANAVERVPNFVA